MAGARDRFRWSCVDKAGRQDPSPRCWSASQPKPGGRARLILVFSLLMPLAAKGDDPAASAARLTWLFVNGCLAHPGSARGLRAWVARQNLPVLPPAEQAQVLNGRPGIGYDGSNRDGHFALASFNNGWCVAWATDADRAPLIRELEAALHRADVSFIVQDDSEYQGHANMRDRLYALVRSGRRLTLLMTTTVIAGPTGSEYTQAALGLQPKE